MDKSNLYNLQRMATAENQGKIKLLMDYARNFSEKEVPDPYTSFGQRFEHILTMIEDAALGVIEQVKLEIDGNQIIA